ncbi:MAG: 2-oxoisovalerate dehydrogenase [Candidatus Sericytochromatia bacterium]|nr:2-oxoisovalerate dehydrogenase [Candidatus Sericytochromatia bacterium]
MNTEIIFLIEESIDGGYEAKALGHSIFTEADSYEELKESVKDAVQCHFEGENMPKMIRLHLVKEEVIAV